MVAVDPGHGGCLDWGVPNPYDNKAAKSEKADTLGIALALKRLFEAQGITVVLTRSEDVALAGDDYPALGCHGAPFRDVNGDGFAGFGSRVPEATRTRDELSARIDLANLTRADLAVSIHINSMTQNGVLYRIAATQSYYTDAFTWSDASRRLGDDVQRGVVASMARVASYRRQDRGVDGTAPYLYFLKPPGRDPTSPNRGLFMPAILSEVGSMSLQAESDLLATDRGREAAAEGVFDGIAAYLRDRPFAIRLDAQVPGGLSGTAPQAVNGTGPLFWPPVLSGRSVTLRLTNTGTAPWPAGMRPAAAWGTTGRPYLAVAPGPLLQLASTLPSLAPGEAIEVPLTLPAPPSGGRAVAWLTVVDSSGRPATADGIAPLQLATQGP